MRVAGKRITKLGFALFAIVLIGLSLRVYQLSTQSLWLDEGFSVWMSKMSLSQIVQATSADFNPPLYYFILHYWMKVFGTSESAVRLLSALFGVLAIPMIYLVGRQLFNKETGLIAALILALSSYNIWYSQETRMYSLMVLLALFSMYFFLRFLQQSTLALSAGYVLSTTLLVYTHGFGPFVVIAQNIYVVTLLLLSRRRTHQLRHWVALQAIVLTLFVPWMVIFARQILRRAATGAPPPPIAAIIDTFSNYSGITNFSGTTVLLALFLGLSVLSLFAYQKASGAMDWNALLNALKSYSWEVRLQDPAPAYFLAVWLIAINLVPFIISQFSSSIYVARYTIAASVALYLLVAKGIGNINYRPTKVAVIGVIVVLSVANLQVYYSPITKYQVREATHFIDANAKSGDLVLVFPAWQPWTFDYYNKRTDIAVKQILTKVKSPENSSEALVKELQTDVTGHDRVWLFLATFSPSANPQAKLTLSILNESYARSYVRNYCGYGVYLYEKRA